MLEPRRFTIVTAVDFSEMSEVVIETALDMAARHDLPELHVLTALQATHGLLGRDQADYDGDLEELGSRLCDLLGEKLGDFGHPLDDLKSWRVYTHARLGDPAEQIVNLAWEADADLIVLGRHSDTGRRRFIIGSVPQRVMHLARCPVLVAQPTDYETDHDAGTEPRDEPCAACVATRRESEGSRWFCERHSDIRLTRSTVMAHHQATVPNLGGPLW